MPIQLTEDQLDFLDELLFMEWTVEAARFIRASASCSLKEAIHELLNRRQELGINFGGYTLARVNAFDKLSKITEHICVIEGCWRNNGGLGGFIKLKAITNQRSQAHIKYTQHNLTEFNVCFIEELNARELTMALAEELALAAHTTFYLNGTDFLSDTEAEYKKLDNEKRWWDTH